MIFVSQKMDVESFNSKRSMPVPKHPPIQSTVTHARMSSNCCNAAEMASERGESGRRNLQGDRPQNQYGKTVAK